MGLVYRSLLILAVFLTSACVKVTYNYDACEDDWSDDGVSWMIENSNIIRSNNINALQGMLSELLYSIELLGSDFAFVPDVVAEHDNFPKIVVLDSNELYAETDICIENRVIKISTGLLNGMYDQSINYSASLYPNVDKEKLASVINNGHSIGLGYKAAASVASREFRKSVVWVLAHEMSHALYDVCGEPDENIANILGMVVTHMEFVNGCGLPSSVTNGVVERLQNNSDVNNAIMPTDLYDTLIFMQYSMRQPISNISPGERALGRSGAGVALDLFRMGFKDTELSNDVSTTVTQLENLNRIMSYEWLQAIKNEISGEDDQLSFPRFYINSSTGCPCFRDSNEPLN